VPSLTARAFPSLATIEGWAHYAEELALELRARRAGDTEADDAADGHSLACNELAHVRMALLRDCRYLVTFGLHAGDLSLDDAAVVIARWTGLPSIRARQEALRAALDPSCLVYTLGKLLLVRLREDYARQEGDAFTLRRFHDALFACGALPLPLLRRALMRTDDSRPLA
jgi:uncharacterized protein (DUF885 family)